MVALSKGCKSVNVSDDVRNVPAGCGSVVLSPTLTVFLLVKVSVIPAAYLVAVPTVFPIGTR